MSSHQEEIWSQALTGRTPQEDGGRDRGDARTSQGTPTMAGKLPATRDQAWSRFSLGDLGVSRPHCPCFRTSGLQSRGTTHFCCFKPLRLWYIVTAALANPYRAPGGSPGPEMRSQTGLWDMQRHWYAFLPMTLSKLHQACFLPA